MKTYSRTQVALYCTAAALLTAASIGVYQLTRPEPPAPGQARGMAYRPRPVDVSAPHGRAVVRKRYEEIIARRDAVFPLDARNQTMRLLWGLDLWQNMYWFGIPVLKSPSDMWMMQQIIAEVRPDYIIEAGTSLGGSALYFAHVLAGLGLSGARVITIDIQNRISQVSKHALWQKHVEFVHGSSTDPVVVSDIVERVKGSTVMVVLDSDHHRDHVLNELEAYAPLVTLGSYIVVEDTSVDAIPLVKRLGPGPMAAVKVFLGTNVGKSFKPDRSREIFLVTFHPGGWLMRVR